MKVLIVDDKSENLYLLESILKGSGYMTVSANNGEEALALARKDIPDLIITDILMPVMDGFTLCREFKKDGKLCNVPFIFYTATYSDPRDEEFALNLGADRFILKPQDPEEFIAIVKELLKEEKKKNTYTSEAPSKPEIVILKEYNETLVRKLEDKMLKLEQSEKEIKKNNILLLKEIEEHKRAEEKLHESEELFRITAENLTDVIFNADLKENINYYGDIDGIMGYPPGEFPRTFEAWVAAIHPEDKDRVTAALEDHLKGVATYTIEYRVRRRDGEWRWWSARGTALRDDRGEPYKMIGSITDITEQKDIQNKIKFNSELLRHIGQSVIATDLEGDVIYWNNGAEEIYGWSTDEAMGQNIVILTPTEQTKEQAIEIMKVLIEGNSWSGEFLVKRKDGSIFPAEVTDAPIIDSDGKLIGVIGVSSDITERKRAETELSEKEYLLSQSQQLAHIGSWGWKLGGPLKWSDETYRVYGVSKETFTPTSETLFDLIHPEDRSAMRQWLEASVSSQSSHNIEFRTILPDGTIRFINGTGDLIFDSEGKPTYMAGTVQDITERKRAEKNLIEAKEKAEEINRLKSNFLANMSHELRTPLVGILGFADILRQEVEPQEVKAMADTIYKSGKRLSETLNLILDLSKFESEKWDIKHSKIDLVSKTEEIINSFEATANKKGLTLQSSFSQDSLIINFDERAYNSILNNLINNAIKFTSEGSVTTTILLNNDFVEIKVIDTGIGIAEQDYLNIFEEFRQASEGYNRNFEGSGLGLSITKKLVEKFGGSISVESEIGKGSTFTLKLPVTNVEEKEKDPTSTKTQIPKTSPEQISVKPIALLVDDDPFVFTVLKRYTHEYIELETTVEAEFAIKKLKNKQYDLIFMDINLRRGMDGKEATRKIRTMKGYENIPIIATTAYAMLGDREEFLTAGCTHYLSKPFSQEEIVSLLEDVFTLV